MINLSRLKKYIVFFLMFFISLIYFVFTNGWYEKDRLIIKGKTEVGGIIDLKWDSGAGYNDYEFKRFLLKTKLDRDGDLLAGVQYLGEKNPASLSTSIVCTKFNIDNKNILPTDSEKNIIKYNNKSGIILDKRYNKLFFQVSPVSSVEIELLTNNHSGKAKIVIGDESFIKDLYIANEAAKSELFQYWVVNSLGEFTLNADLPRYSVKSYLIERKLQKKNLVVNSIEVVSDGERQEVPFFEDGKTLITFDLGSLRKKHYFAPFQFVCQVCFSLVTAWFLSIVFFKIQSVASLKSIFAEEKKIFWLFFTGSVVIFSFWLAAFWPGVMSIDSLLIWRAALLPEVFSNDHPLFNILLYMYLSQIWNNPAIVPIFHIIIMSWLIGYIFCTIYKYGVRLRYLIPFYFFLILSVPIGLYNIILWKDIPFAILVVLLAFTIADLYRKKTENAFFLSIQKKIVLLLLLAGIVFLRHNGIVFLVVVPVLLALLRLTSLRFFLIWSSLIAVFLLAVGFFLKISNNLGMINYFSTHMSSYINNIFNEPIAQLFVKVFKNYWGILDVNQTRSKWDLWHFFLRDRYAYSFLSHAGWSDIYPFLPENGSMFNSMKEICMKIYWKTYEVPYVYITWNPVFFLTLFPLSLLFFKKVPLTAIFSIIILSMAIPLVIIEVFNWRYYYFVYLGCLFLGPLFLYDLKRNASLKGLKSHVI